MSEAGQTAPAPCHARGGSRCLPSAVSSRIFSVWINYVVTESAFIPGYCFTGQNYRNTPALLMMLIRAVIKCLTSKQCFSKVCFFSKVSFPIQPVLFFFCRCIASL